MTGPQAPTVVFWGTYDTGKPRVRLLLDGLRANGVEVVECHRDIWSGVRDKSVLGGPAWPARLARCLAAYPLLLWRYMRAPRHHAVVCAYMGLLDVLALWLPARLRGAVLVWDVFIPLYEAVVQDRNLAAPGSLAARALHVLEGLACRAADVLLMDTGRHAAALEYEYGLWPGRVGSVPVGAEGAHFRPREMVRHEGRPFTVLFYGQCIPLHGIDVIVRACAELARSGADMRCVLVGSGQEEAAVDALIAELGLTNIERIPWVPYEELAGRIQAADVCLGIFRGTGKAALVVPNKVYQVLATGAVLVTADTPAVREALPRLPQLRLVPPDDPVALARELLAVREDMEQGRLAGRHAPWLVDAAMVGRCLLEQVPELAGRGPGA